MPIMEEVLSAAVSEEENALKDVEDDVAAAEEGNDREDVETEEAVAVGGTSAGGVLESGGVLEGGAVTEVALEVETLDETDDVLAGGGVKSVAGRLEEGDADGTRCIPGVRVPPSNSLETRMSSGDHCGSTTVKFTSVSVSASVTTGAAPCPSVGKAGSGI